MTLADRLEEARKTPTVEATLDLLGHLVKALDDAEDRIDALESQVYDREVEIEKLRKDHAALRRFAEGL